MIRHLSAATAAVVAFTAGSQAALMQLDINGIQINAGRTFDGVTHTGILTLTDPAGGVLLDILVDGVSQGGAALANVEGEIFLSNGFVTGGYLMVMDGDGDTYFATIGELGRVNAQAGRGFQIDGLTFSGVFGTTVADPRSGFVFGNTDVSALFGANAFNESLVGSFLVTSFNPNANGFDERADLDVFILPTPGSAALAGLAGLTILRRKR
ncbi:MAG: hypothetical protein KF684_07115 [Phycisphaeraceae bacterium]|nr:hypothetical protein [Phycisphaeraceae bacterium]